jgi:hypothetical protein
LNLGIRSYIQYLEAFAIRNLRTHDAVVIRDKTWLEVMDRAQQWAVVNVVMNLFSSMGVKGEKR